MARVGCDLCAQSCDVGRAPRQLDSEVMFDAPNAQIGRVVAIHMRNHYCALRLGFDLEERVAS